MDTILTLLASAGATLILLRGEIFQGPRNQLREWIYRRGKECVECKGKPGRWVLAERFTYCALCIGFWCGLAFGRSFRVACASALISYVINLWLAKMERPLPSPDPIISGQQEASMANGRQESSFPQKGNRKCPQQQP